MKVEVIISDNDEIGPLSEKEEIALDELRAFFADGFEIEGDKLCTGTSGWLGAAGRGASAIGQVLINRYKGEEDPLRRLPGVIGPWVPPGECWEKFIGEYHYFTHWKITFRAWEPLEEA
jgi:hypothetical protein